MFSSRCFHYHFLLLYFSASMPWSFKFCFLELDCHTLQFKVGLPNYINSALEFGRNLFLETVIFFPLIAPFQYHVAPNERTLELSPDWNSMPTGSWQRNFVKIFKKISQWVLKNRHLPCHASMTYQLYQLEFWEWKALKFYHPGIKPHTPHISNSMLSITLNCFVRVKAVKSCAQHSMSNHFPTGKWAVNSGNLAKRSHERVLYKGRTSVQTYILIWQYRS